MSWQDRWKRALLQDILFLPVSAKTVPREVVEALEAKRARRLRELDGWQPSKGWHIAPAIPSDAAASAHRERWTKH